MSEKDGGPAFPNWKVAPVGPDGTDTTVPTAGMSLRDYFAGQALAGMGWWVSAAPEADGGKARAAYALADAMLSARTALSAARGEGG